MAFDPKSIKFGSAIKEYIAKNAPSAQEISERPIREDMNSYVARMAPSPEQLGGIEVSRLKPKITVEQALDPKELDRQQRIQKIDYRLQEYQTQLLRENPEYYYSIVEPDNEHTRFGTATKLAFTAEFAARSALKEEELISEYLTFGEQFYRQARRTGGVFRFLGSVLQDIPRGAAGLLVAGPLQSFGVDALADGRMTSDAWWYKLLIGQDIERDYFGRVTKKTPRDIRSVIALQQEYEAALRKGQDPNAPKTLKGEIIPIFGSRFGAAAMLFLEADISILPLAGISKLAAGAKLTRGAIGKMTGSLEELIVKSGVAWTEETAKAAAEASRRALKAKDALTAQGIIHEFIRKVVPEGSVGAKVVDSIDASIQLEIAQSRATLDSLASAAPTYDDFVTATERAILDERAVQRNVLARNLEEVTTAPAFRAGQARLAEIYREFGEGLDDASLFKSTLKADAPDAIKTEFENIKSELSDIIDNTVTPITNQLIALSDNVPVGEGAFDITKNLLADSKKGLRDLLTDIYDNAKGRRVSAIYNANGAAMVGREGNDILDALEMVQRQITDVRVGRASRSTAVEQVNDYLYAEAIARGAMTRQAAEEIAAGVPEAVIASVPAPKEIPAVSPVSEKVFNNIRLSLGDTLIVAADDAAKAKTFDEFVKNSEEVVYQAEGNLTFIRDKGVSDAITKNEINPPVILDMKQPLRLDLTTTEVHRYIAEEVSLKKDIQATLGQPIEPQLAARLLESARAYGFDGVVFNRVIDGKTTTGRIAVIKKQVIPAAQFYDNVKGGVDSFGPAVSLTVRRQNQGDDILKKLLPTTVGTKVMAKTLVKEGVPKELSEQVVEGTHAHFLDTFLETGAKEEARIPNLAFNLEDTQGHRVGVNLDKNGLVVTLIKGTGEQETIKSIKLKDKNGVDKLYKNVVSAFEKDTAKRVESMKGAHPGAISETAFKTLGKGHKTFNDVLNKRVQEGVFLPEEALLIRTAMKDVDDSILGNVPLLETSVLDIGKFGVYSKTHNKITLRRGLAYAALKGEMRLGSRLTDAGNLATRTFLHEFGHLGHHTLLSPAQKKLVKEVYKKIPRKELEKFFAHGPDSIKTIGRYLDNENEFFAQAFAEYVMRNRLLDTDMLPLFERITQQLKAVIRSVMSKKTNVATGKMDALHPLFDQLLRGESQATATKRAEKIAKNVPEELVYDIEKLPKRNPIENGARDFGTRQPLISRKAVEDERKLLQSMPKGKGIPESIRMRAISQEAAPPAKPPKKPHEVDAKEIPPALLDAKIPSDITRLSPTDPALLQKIAEEEVFGKGVRVHSALRRGQKKLVSTMTKMQRALVSKEKQMLEAVVELRRQRDEAIVRGKMKFATADAVKKELVSQIDKETALLRKFDAEFTSAQYKEMARMAARVKTQKQLTEAIHRIQQLADNQYRAKSREMITEVKADVALGTAKIPVQWQERIEELVGDITTKLFKTPYKDRLKALKEWIEESDAHALEVEKFSSIKSLRMLRDLEELEKRSVEEIGTEELMKTAIDISKLYDEGKAAQFVLKGGKTKEISRKIVTGVDADGNPIIKKFIIQKGGELVDGLERLQIDNQIAAIQDARKAGDVANLDHDIVTKKYGDITTANRSVYKMVWEGMRDTKLGDPNSWQRGVMTYLTSDRVFELLDNMTSRGFLYQMIRKPLARAIDNGEKAGTDTLAKFVDMEKRLTKEFNLPPGPSGKDNGFMNGNYERIAIYAYLKQGMKNKLHNLIPEEIVVRNGEKVGVDIVSRFANGEEKLLPHEMKMYEFMREELDKLWPGIDTVMREQHGTRIGKIENYFPIQNNILDNRTLEEVLNIEYIPNKRQTQRFFTEARYMTSNAEMKLNAREIFKKHVRDVNYFVQVEPELQRVGKLTRDKGFRETVGDNAGLWMEQYVDIIARRGTPKNYDFNIWDEFRKNLGAATLGFNPSPIIKQPLAAMAAMGAMGPKSVLIDGVGLMYRHNLFDDIGEVSAEQALRYADDPAFVDLSVSGRISNWQEKGYRGIKYTDAQTARAVWLAAYTKRLGQKGKKFNVQNFKNKIGIDAEAVDFADNMVRKTQGSGKFQDLPLLLTNKNKKVWTYIFQFQSFLLGQSQMLMHDALTGMLMAARGKGKTTLIDATGKAIKISAFVSAGLYTEAMISRHMLTALYGSEASKERAKEDGWMSAAVINDMLSAAFPPYGAVADLINPNQATLGVPVIDKVWRGAVSAGKVVTSADPETKFKEAFRASEAAVAVFGGLPGTTFVGQLTRNVVMEPLMKNPAEKLKEAVESGDKARAAVLLQEFYQDGLDVEEVAAKVSRAIESDKRAERKDVVDKVTKMIVGIKSDADRIRVAEQVRQMIVDGTLTDEHIQDIDSAVAAFMRKKSIGE